MRVFKACCIVMKRRATSMIIYLVVFSALAVTMALAYSDKKGSGFIAEEPLFTIINRDKDSALVQGLKEYMNTQGKEIILEDDKETIQDAVFYHESDYIAIIPEKFNEKFMKGIDVSIEKVTFTNSSTGYYTDNLVNQYLNMVRLFIVSEPEANENDIIKLALEELSNKVNIEKKNFGVENPINDGYKSYYRMYVYIILILTIFCVSNILNAFKRHDLNNRNLCSPLKASKINLQLVLCAFVISFICWLSVTIVGLILFNLGSGDTDIRSILLIILNTFIFMFVAMSIAMAVGNFGKSMSIQNAIANMTALGLSFIGGIFVPLELLGEKVISVAKFTPGYWYADTLDKICKLNSFDLASLKPVFNNLIIQMFFSVAILSIALALNKYLNRPGNSYVEIKTEIQA